MGALRTASGVAILLVCPAAVWAQAGAGPGSTGSFPPADAPPVASAPGSASAAPARSPPPPSSVPPQPAPPPGYYPPPPGYVYPPPGYSYPPPGYYYPPPPSYAEWAQPAQRKPQYPDDAAGQTSPYLDLLAGGIVLDNRFEHLMAIGVQGGAYLATRVRITARVLMFTSGPDDNYARDYNYYDSTPFPSGFSPVASDKPVLLYGASLGAAPVVRRNFVFAPGLAFMRSNVADYGSFLELSMPFEWVTDDGARFGF